MIFKACRPQMKVALAFLTFTLVSINANNPLPLPIFTGKRQSLPNEILTTESQVTNYLTNQKVPFTLFIEATSFESYGEVMRFIRERNPRFLNLAKTFTPSNNSFTYIFDYNVDELIYPTLGSNFHHVNLGKSKLELVSENPEVSNNGSVIFIERANLQILDEQLPTIIKLLNKQFDDNYVIIFAFGKKARAISQVANLQLLEIGSRVRILESVRDDPEDIGISPIILTGYLIGLMIFAIIWFGTDCLFQIQTQDNFPTVSLIVGEEH
eukprot:TRINITY_DN2107_c0_g1_i4.p1 TRINITY_DN2107_c0_g1~~TRINITY_DN2107_c0_g1_i4.p1  ORF type:complete len:268 (-),score=45.36 TRINITY_DN2107_c0_g1_i4:76-879(-)